MTGWRREWAVAIPAVNGQCGIGVRRVVAVTDDQSWKPVIG